MKNEDNSRTYFKMHKNPTTSLKTKEDYLRWSENCLKEANAYHEVSFRCKDMMLSQHGNAVFTNISFACELYLKHLLLAHNIDCRREHNLYKLFKKLPEETQEHLKNKHPCGNILIENFELELDDVGQAFMIFRYMYERGNMASNIQFLIELLFTLHNVANNNVKR
ncbi:hypothetical protein [Sporosarcina sp. OR05]|uniref:hypothetical protein n=1 Tax=Sporosarcina sp. OR05 TaxID=2969819 RepID=UPI00352A8425